MPTAFITGATGFLGRHVVDVLREQGWSIIALVRDKEKALRLIGDDVRLITGDLTFPTGFQDKIQDTIDCIFHIAADTSTWSKEAKRQHLVNVDGTSGILHLCRNIKAKRFVHVSSIAVYGLHKELVTETTPKYGKESWVSYVSTKTMAERKVIEAAGRGTDAVIVNPTHIVGRYDDHNWSRMIQMLHRGELPGVPPGAGNFANGRAVAEGVVAAFHKGKTGENYILGGPYASMHEFLSIAAAKLGHTAPGKPMPSFVLKMLAGILSIVSKINGKRPMITPEEAYFAAEMVNASSEKAVRELGYKEIPLDQSVDECITYLKERKLL